MPPATWIATYLGPMRQAVAALSLLLAAGCGGAGSTTSTTQTQQTPGAAAPVEVPVAPTSDASSAATTASARSDTAFKLLKSGFGLQGEYAYPIALVRNDSDKSGGTVTASFNLLDAAGSIIATESQVESFPRPGFLLAIGTQMSVPAGAKPAKVEATINVEWPGIGSQDPFPAIPTTPAVIKKAEYGDNFMVSSTLTNPTKMTLKSPRVAIICYDTAGVPIGGGVSFPDLVPPGGRVRVNADVLTKGKPTKCDLSVSAPI